MDSQARTSAAQSIGIAALELACAKAVDACNLEFLARRFAGRIAAARDDAQTVKVYVQLQDGKLKNTKKGTR